MLRIYLAAGWFDHFQEKALTYLEKYLFDRPDFLVYSPRKEIIAESSASISKQKFIFEENIKNIRKSDLIVSSTVGKDMGTLWECGFAFQSGKPIVYTFFDERFQNAKFNLMLSASGIACFTEQKEFEKFMEKINEQNFLNLKQDYQGQIE